MGEYAIRRSDRERVKIGTCSDMYYLRFEQRNLVSADSGSVDILHHPEGNRFRLPFLDEDAVRPGDFDEFNRALPLSPYSPPEDVTVQECFSWATGKRLSYPAHAWALSSVRATREDDGKLHLFPVIRCTQCEQAWRQEWADILPLVADLPFRERLAAYAVPVDPSPKP